MDRETAVDYARSLFGKDDMSLSSWLHFVKKHPDQASYELFEIGLRKAGSDIWETGTLSNSKGTLSGMVE